ncbi:MAG: hypothetical protein IT532_06460 [Burkholderiales bacterium]|nr:hypothetical protein [Burkholderiales bacterium]
MLRRLILCLLMLWLPLQGFAAQTMTFCRHDLARLGGMADASGTALVGVLASGHQDALEHGVPPHQAGTHAKGLQCKNCGSCRLACAAVLPTAAAGFVIQAVAVAPSLLTPLAPASVVLDLPHPPPLPSL